MSHRISGTNHRTKGTTYRMKGTGMIEQPCHDCGGSGKVTVSSRWTVDAREPQWARTYTEQLDIECDTCEGIGYHEQREGCGNGV